MGVDDTPESILDALRETRPGDEATRDQQLAHLVAKFPVEQLRDAVRTRLRNLGGRDGEAILRLVEAYATPPLLDELAEALIDQPDLAADRAWEALALLDGAGVLAAHPELVERWDELNEAFGDDGDEALSTLVAQLEEEPQGSWVALQGLGAVEPEVRAEIIAGLADFPNGPGLVAFLRLLSFAHDPTTRQSALDALAARANDDPDHVAAWAEIAHDHPDPIVVARARRWLGAGADLAVAEALEGPSRANPQPVGNLVTAIDGSGRGSIVIASRDRGHWVVASFVCDVWRGVVEVFGQVGDDPAAASHVFEEFEDQKARDLIEDAPGLADGLLAACLLLCGPTTNPVLRYWLERTVGPGFRPRPFPSVLEDSQAELGELTNLVEPSRLILEACPGWVDDSELTYEMAEEIALRSGELAPDPRRDAGAYRYLFEHRLLSRLEHYRRLLLWMAAFWNASGDVELAHAAHTLAWQLADPQHAVPSHPFTIALSTQSLATAQANILAGRDPRNKRRDQ